MKVIVAYESYVSDYDDDGTRRIMPMKAFASREAAERWVRALPVRIECERTQRPPYTRIHTNFGPDDNWADFSGRPSSTYGEDAFVRTDYWVFRGDHRIGGARTPEAVRTILARDPWETIGWELVELDVSP